MRSSDELEHHLYHRPENSKCPVRSHPFTASADAAPAPPMAGRRRSSPPWRRSRARPRSPSSSPRPLRWCRGGRRDRQVRWFSWLTSHCRADELPQAMRSGLLGHPRKHQIYLAQLTHRNLLHPDELIVANLQILSLVCLSSPFPPSPSASHVPSLSHRWVVASPLCVQMRQSPALTDPFLFAQAVRDVSSAVLAPDPPTNLPLDSDGLCSLR